MLPLTSGFQCHYSYLCRYVSISLVFWELCICVVGRQRPMATACFFRVASTVLRIYSQLHICRSLVRFIAATAILFYFYIFFHFDHFWCNSYSDLDAIVKTVMQPCVCAIQLHWDWHPHGCSRTNPYIGLILHTCEGPASPDYFLVWPLNSNYLSDLNIYTWIKLHAWPPLENHKTNLFCVYAAEQKMERFHTKLTKLLSMMHVYERSRTPAGGVPTGFSLHVTTTPMVQLAKSTQYCNSYASSVTMPAAHDFQVSSSVLLI